VLQHAPLRSAAEKTIFRDVLCQGTISVVPQVLKNKKGALAPEVKRAKFSPESF
jgi:hypothetical protein